VTYAQPVRAVVTEAGESLHAFEFE